MSNAWCNSTFLLLLDWHIRAHGIDAESGVQNDVQLMSSHSQKLQTHFVQPSMDMYYNHVSAADLILNQLNVAAPVLL